MFKVGDKVINLETPVRYGVVISVDSKNYDGYPISVLFDRSVLLDFTVDGRRLSNMEPTLIPNTKLHRALT